jgi:hypothetical protein
VITIKWESHLPPTFVPEFPVLLHSFSHSDRTCCH